MTATIDRPFGEFVPTEKASRLGGVQYTFFFPNNYGASVVRFSGSYGGDEGLWELAVLKGTPDDWDICYDTPITDDVLGHLEAFSVGRTLDQIAQLTA